MRISTMTYTFTATHNAVDAERIPETAARCGVEGLDWVGTCGLSPQRARQLTLDAGLAVSCYTSCPVTAWHGTDRQATVDEIKRDLDNAAALGAPCIMIVPFPPNDTEDRAAGRRYWYSMLQDIAPIAEQAGIILTIEDFQGVKSPFVTADEMLLAQREVPTLHFTLDAGNAALGENPVDTCRKLAGTIAYVHLQDLDVFSENGPDRFQGIDGRFYKKVPLGQGCLDLTGLLKELKHQNYTGFMDIEYEGASSPETIVSNAVTYLKARI